MKDDVELCRIVLEECVRGRIHPTLLYPPRGDAWRTQNARKFKT